VHERSPTARRPKSRILLGAGCLNIENAGPSVVQLLVHWIDLVVMRRIWFVRVSADLELQFRGIASVRRREDSCLLVEWGMNMFRNDTSVSTRAPRMHCNCKINFKRRPIRMP